MRNLVIFLTCLALPLSAMADTFTIELEPGWNLVSMPITPGDPNPESVFGHARLGPVWEWGGRVYEHAQQLRALQGYWVFCEKAEARTADAVTVEIVGTPPSTRVTAMALGWSMVGTIEGEVAQLLAATRRPIFGWDSRRQNYRVMATPEAPTANPPAAADPQEGFWVFMPGDYLVIDVSAGPAASTYPVSYLSDVPADGWTDEYKTTKIVLRRIPAGPFVMGSPADELGRDTDETQRQVTLSTDFYIGVFEVTQKQWERVMGDYPSYFENMTHRETRPLENISWNDIRGGTWPGSPAGSGQPTAGTFIQKLRDRTGLTGIDLPTEAQREYAARAATTTALNSGKNLTAIDSCPNMAEVGRYWHNGGSSYTPDGNTSVGTAKVGSYLPNTWGLYDMHGNVWEWCLDWYTTNPAGGADPLGPSSGEQRMARGGAWSYGAQYCRSASRARSSPALPFTNLGFRLVRTVP